jgi:sugar O-acyltransferase (sialic acid O-acetyltransferase NeuD family)
VAAQPLILVAASGLAREVLSVLRTRVDRHVLGFLDDDAALQGTAVDGLPVLGALESVTEHPEAGLVVCAGSGKARSTIVQRLSDLGVDGGRYVRVIDPTVRVPASCAVGAGSILLAQTVLTADVQVGNHVVTMPHAVLTHDDAIGDYATVCAGVALGGNVTVGMRAYLGMNSSVRQGVRVGSDATLGMGSVLLTDLPDGEVWAGTPARALTKEGIAVL